MFEGIIDKIEGIFVSKKEEEKQTDRPEKNKEEIKIKEDLISSEKMKENEIKVEENKNKSKPSTDIKNILGDIKNLFKKNEKVEKEKEEKQYQMKFNYNLEKTDLEGRNILHRTCFNLKKDVISSLLSQMKDFSFVNTEDKYGNTPLILACKKFIPMKKIKALKVRKQIIESLCQKGAKIEIQQKRNKWTAFHWLCFNGDFESLKYLYFHKNALFFVPDKQGYFPIDIAGIKVSLQLKRDTNK